MLLTIFFSLQHNLVEEKSTLEFGEVLQQMRNTFKSGKSRDVKFRRRQLEALMKMYEECEEEMIEALQADLRYKSCKLQ